MQQQALHHALMQQQTLQNPLMQQQITFMML
jgi:hypothetical protein